MKFYSQYSHAIRNRLQLQKRVSESTKDTRLRHQATLNLSRRSTVHQLELLFPPVRAFKARFHCLFRLHTSHAGVIYDVDGFLRKGRRIQLVAHTGGKDFKPRICEVNWCIVLVPQNGRVRIADSTANHHCAAIFLDGFQGRILHNARVTGWRCIDNNKIVQCDSNLCKSCDTRTFHTPEQTEQLSPVGQGTKMLEKAADVFVLVHLFVYNRVALRMSADCGSVFIVLAIFEF